MLAPFRALSLCSAVALAACTDGNSRSGPSPPPVPHFEGDYSLVDGGMEEPGWSSFRDTLRARIARRDTAAFLETVAPDARLSYETDAVGPGGYRDLWFSGSPPNGRDPWSTLESALNGGSLDEDGAVIVPFVYGLWPHDEFDALSSVALVGDSIVVRSGPSADADIVATVSNRIVPALAPPDQGWRLVRLPDAQSAYVATDHTLSPAGYHATFWTEPDGTWLLRSFLAGD